ncbi:MAG TPA: trypsin-like peptidase domain-containing protein [Burkholderiales bacterium]|jgi:serine protease DegQ|nr:trypsin-like peptidase domain-containing protein [Burkholderiales bacterium]
MRKLWLTFCQTATVCLAVLFVISTLRPDLLASAPQGVAAAVKEPQREEPGPAAVTSFSSAVRKAMPAVVNIYTSQEVKRPRQPLMDDPVFRYFFGEQGDPGVQRREGLGSGVIVSDKGYILTNHHVVESVDQIEVALADARKVPARVVGTDPDTDLAVLKIDLPRLPAITFGNAEVRVGDVVLAIGNPFGVGQTVTLGIVSALGRTQLGITTFESFIQTDATIQPGNSGGALVDTSGNLIGINTAIYSQSPRGESMGIGFAIPVSIARQVMEQIIRDGAVTRGWIGVGGRDITRELAETLQIKANRGALITQVVRDGPADQAGVKPGDVLVGVNGAAVGDWGAVLNLVAVLKPGEQAKLRLQRENADTDLTVTIGRRPRVTKRE